MSVLWLGLSPREPDLLAFPGPCWRSRLVKDHGPNSQHSPTVHRFFAALGLLIPLVLGAGMAIPATREATTWFAFHEHHPVEIMTPIAMFAAGIVSARLSLRLRRLDGPSWVVTFYGLFALGMFLVGMEEISWGQQIFHWETPPIFDWNRQGETNFHNNPFLQGKTELLRLTFGLSGLVGIWLGGYPRFALVGAPTSLLTWFGAIVVLAAADLINDYVYTVKRIDIVVKLLSETVELMVGLSGLLYVWFRSRCLPRDLGS